MSEVQEPAVAARPFSQVFLCGTLTEQHGVERRDGKRRNALTVSIDGQAVSVLVAGKLCEEAEKLELDSLVRVTGRLALQSWDRQQAGAVERLAVEAESVTLAKLPNHGRLGVYTGDVA